MDDWILVVVFLLGIAATVPQLKQTLETGTTRDLNPWNLVVNLALNLLLTVYWFLKRDYKIMVIGIWYIGFYLWMAVLKGYEGKRGEAEKKETVRAQMG